MRATSAQAFILFVFLSEQPEIASATRLSLGEMLKNETVTRTNVVYDKPNYELIDRGWITHN